MSHFQVDADFFFDTAIPGSELTDFLIEQCQDPDDSRIHRISFQMNADDSLDVRFIVEAETYTGAAEAARGFLSRVETNLSRWLRESKTGSSIEDESLLLMLA